MTTTRALLMLIAGVALMLFAVHVAPQKQPVYCDTIGGVIIIGCH